MEHDNESPANAPQEPTELTMKVPAGTEDWNPDLVVIDRRALTQMLDAVINVLDATKGMELLHENPEFTSEQIEKASFDLAKVREALAQGIRQMQDSVSRLPTVKVKEEG